MIRGATYADIPAIMEILARGGDQMGFPEDFGTPLDIKSGVDVLCRAIESDAADLSVYVHDCDIVGVSLVELVPFLWNQRVVIAREHVWHVDPAWGNKTQARKAFIGLLDHMVAWSTLAGASRFSSSAKPDLPAGKLLARRGFKHFDNTYLGGL